MAHMDVDGDVPSGQVSDCNSDVEIVDVKRNNKVVNDKKRHHTKGLHNLYMVTMLSTWLAYNKNTLIQINRVTLIQIVTWKKR